MFYPRWHEGLFEILAMTKVYWTHLFLTVVLKEQDEQEPQNFVFLSESECASPDINLPALQEKEQTVLVEASNAVTENHFCGNIQTPSHPAYISTKTIFMFVFDFPDNLISVCD